MTAVLLEETVVVSDAELLRQCHASGQMTAAQSVAHAEAGELYPSGPISMTELEAALRGDSND